jgi:hypothetical protein
LQCAFCDPTWQAVEMQQERLTSNCCSADKAGILGPSKAIRLTILAKRGAHGELPSNYVPQLACGGPSSRHFPVNRIGSRASFEQTQRDFQKKVAASCVADNETSVREKQTNKTIGPGNNGHHAPATHLIIPCDWNF